MQTLINDLRPMTSWNDFARSLCEQYDVRGSLSDKQISSAQRMIDKMATNKKRREEMKQSFDTTKIDELFSTAKGNGLKRPNFYVGDWMYMHSDKTKKIDYFKNKNTRKYIEVAYG